MIAHFELVRGKERFLVFRLGADFHIIDINEALTREKRFAVLESGCTPTEMQEMGLSGTTIARSDLTAITVTGCGPQDDVIFYLGKKQLGYRFAMAYEQKRVDDFFRGIPRVQYKTRYRFRRGLDWRAREQDLRLLPKFEKIGLVYNTLCWGVALGLLFTERKMFAVWFWAILLLVALGVFFNAAYPLYFAFYWYKGDDTQRGKGKAVHIGLGIMIMFCAAVLRNPYVVLDWQKLIVPALVLGAIFGIGLYFLCRECREDGPGWLLTILLTVVLSGMVLIPHVNHILGPETEPQSATVVSKHTSSTRRGGRRYYVTVRLRDGTDCDMQVNNQDYQDAEHGDTWEVQLGEGFFGIEYVIDE